MLFELHTHSPARLKNDLLSGLTVALALVPEAVAFAFVAGVQPLVGLYAAFMVGLITAAFGGRPGMISGATGSMAVVMVSLVADHGVEYLFAAVVLAGLIQMLAGVLRLGKFIRIVPYPVMLGFVNGLAIVIFLAQLQHFQIDDGQGGRAWLGGSALWTLLGLVVLTMAIAHYLPRLTTAIPGSLAAILFVTLLALGLHLDVRTVGDVSSIAGSLPSFHIPAVPFNLETLKIVFPYALILAMIGLIESLLTLTLIDEITETRGQPNRECVGQGVANTLTGLFGGMGGCAMIGQSMINIDAGGRGRLSGITAALALLAFILFAAPLIEMIPMAALIGVMFMVVIGTFEWTSLRILNKIPRSDAFVLILVSAVTVFTDLAIAVGIGVVVSALVFAWKHAKRIEADSTLDADGARVYDLHGALYFGSAKEFLGLFDQHADPEQVVLDFRHAKICDHSGIDALGTVAERYRKLGKTLRLRGLNPACRRLVEQADSLLGDTVVEPGHGRRKPATDAG